MLKFIRIILLLVCSIVGFVIAFFAIAWRPMSPKNAHIVTKYFFAPVNKIIGVKVHIRNEEILKDYKDRGVVYAGNHQSNWDIITLADCIQPKTIAIGKKSLAWVPLFGIVYVLSGCVCLDRENKTKAMATMNKVSEDIHSGKYSIWIFPEGTRSKGKGLGKFKSGTILTAAQAQVPIIPIVASNYINNFDLNRWNNGHIVVEYLDPIEYPNYDLKKKEDLKEVKKQTNLLRERFVAKIAELDAIAQELNEKDGVKPLPIKEVTEENASKTKDNKEQNNS